MTGFYYYLLYIAAFFFTFVQVVDAFQFPFSLHRRAMAFLLVGISIAVDPSWYPAEALFSHMDDALIV